MGNIYETIRLLCEKNKITAAEMCRQAGVSSNTMTELKSGRHTGLSAVKAQKIANYFGVTVGYLLGEEEKENPSPEEDELKALIDSLSDEGRKQAEDFLRYLAAKEGIKTP